ncbi:MAG: NAD-dependent DNA ligase LigA [Verrucomicrobia bacterium]|nr:NAD-dependent DNA ligase LigA [Verrucomicrobiota bacterium]
MTFALAAPVASAVAPNGPARNVVSRTDASDDLRRLTPAETEQRLAALRAEIARHDALYRQAAPEISDYDYDRLKRRFAELERAFPELAQRLPPLPAIGDDRTGLFQTYRHRERMMSLDKTYAPAEVSAFHARLAKLLGRNDLVYVVEPKIDGLAVSVTYERGKLVRAVTRGDGIEGDDITANALQISGLPRALAKIAPDGRANPIPDIIELRGEIHVPFSEFTRINGEREAAGESRFANPRNLAAGTVRQLDAREVARRGLQVVFFGVGACVPSAALPATQRDLHARLKAWNLPAPGQIWTARGLVELVRAIEALGRARAGFSFPTDGAVVKLDSFALQREAGAGESTPRWAIAYKFAPERAETQVRAITIQVGRTGVLTPVAELAPVELAGSTIARATLHNRDEIARKDVRVGDTVYVEKAGEVIPAIAGVNLKRRPASAQPYAFPKTCPECRAAVAERTGEVAVRCPNVSCPAQLRRRLEHFASKACVDIEGLGPALIDALVERGLVKELPDLYRLRRADLSVLGKNGGKSAGQLLAGIEASKRAELWRFIHALGIPQVGAVAARDLARRFGSLEALAGLQPEAAGKHAPQTTAGENDSGVPPTVATYFADARHRAIVASFIAAGVQPTSPGVAAGKPALAGKTFVLTGALPALSRAEATARIEAAGGKVGGSVSRATHYVVAGAEPGAKLGRAQALGVPVIDEAALLRMLAEN